MSVPRVALFVVGLLVFVGMLWLLDVYRSRREARQRIERLRVELHDLRTQADSCRGALALEEASFEAFDLRVDSLRDEVRAFESYDERGVPQELYDEYLEAFEDYNEAVPAWRRRAEALRAGWEACRDLIGRHNRLADSLRRAVETFDAPRRGPPPPSGSP